MRVGAWISKILDRVRKKSGLGLIFCGILYDACDYTYCATSSVPLLNMLI